MSVYLASLSPLLPVGSWLSLVLTVLWASLLQCPGYHYPHTCSLLLCTTLTPVGPKLVIACFRKPSLTSWCYSCLGIQPPSLQGCGLSNIVEGLACLWLFPRAHVIESTGSGMRNSCSLSSLSPLSRSARPLHSLSVLAFDQDRLKQKVGAHQLGSVEQDWGVCGFRPGLHSPLLTPQIVALRQARRPVPQEVAQQYQDIVQRSQWQRAQLEQGGPTIRRGRNLRTGTLGRVMAVALS